MFRLMMLVLLLGVCAACTSPEPAVTTTPASASRFFKDCVDCPEMAEIPGGKYAMGSPSDESGRADDEGPRHEVSVPRFALSRFDVTRGEWARFIAATAYRTDAEQNGGCFIWVGRWQQQPERNWRNVGFNQDDRHPVVCISWNDAQAYLHWLNEMARQISGQSYRLPSEAEWQYAARAGTASAWPWAGPEQQCRYANGADKRTQLEVPGGALLKAAPCDDGYAYTAPVGSKPANAFGLYDMHGNAWQWLEDCYYLSYEGAPTDGSAWVIGQCAERVKAGGSWYSFPEDIRSANRFKNKASESFSFLGFRVARAVTNK